MAENDFGESAKAKFFFEKARKAAKNNDFDSAIDMYIEGLRRDPDAVEDGHIELREVALVRHDKGGQKPPREEVRERLQGNTSLEQMLNAEYLLAKDPTHLPYAEAVLKAAVGGGYKKSAKWIADLVFLANNNARRPALQIYLTLKDSYAAIGRFDRALAACECAMKLRPNDKELGNERKRLSEQLSTAEKDDEKLAGVGKAAGIGEIPQAYQTEDGIALAKAKSFFDRAGQVAEIEDFDYAINLYLQGLRHNPEELVDGHLALYELALRRRSKKGKKPSMMERVKQLTGRSPLERMLNSECLFAKDPSHLPYAESMLKAAVAGGYTQTARWIADLAFQTNNAAKKPSLHTYILLKDSYRELGQFDRALAACRCAARLKPQDGDLTDEVKDLTAEVTVARGKYDQEGDFRKSIKDREGQDRLHAQEAVVKTVDYRTLAVQEARKALARDADLPRNIFDLAQALSDLENDKADQEAIQLLENAYKTKSDFSFRQRAGLIIIKQLRRKIKEGKESLESKGEDVKLKAKIASLSAQLNNVELLHYRACVENYPTDLQAKYEYGLRLVRNKQYDEAIPFFQEAQRDPRHKISAMDKIGLCFFMKGWFADAVDVFIQAIEAYRIKDDSTAKELRYNLARAYQEQGDSEKALEIYRKIAQLDFAFKDVRRRIDQLRNLDK
jgi:tetratricopeptide (TPR) repeat protein